MNEQSIKMGARTMLVMKEHTDACWVVWLPGRLMGPNVLELKKGNENLENMTVSSKAVNFWTNQDVI